MVAQTYIAEIGVAVHIVRLFENFPLKSFHERPTFILQLGLTHIHDA